jgi:hypothetical protein
MAKTFLNRYILHTLSDNEIAFKDSEGTRSFQTNADIILDVYEDRNIDGDIKTKLYFKLYAVGTTTDYGYTWIDMKPDLKTTFLSLTDNDSSEEIFNRSYTTEVEFIYNKEKGSYVDESMPLAEFNYTIPHKLDGSKSVIFGIRPRMSLFHKTTNITGTTGGFSATDTWEESEYIYTTIEIPPYSRAAKIITANNFTDEALTASFVYEAPIDSALSKVGSMEACLSLNGETDDLAPYVAISLLESNCVFEFTEAQREYIRKAAINSPTIPVYYITKTICAAGEESITRYDKVQRIISIVGADPLLDPKVKDIKPETLALTGDENTFIRYESMGEYEINATASKHATIVTQYVQCGSKTIYDLPFGVIDGTESGTFNFYVLDSRNQQAVSAVFKNLIEYVKPTCYQKLEVALTGETSAAIKLNVSGNYYDGSFGLVDNTFEIQVRHTDNNSVMGDWVTIDAQPTFNNTTYEVETIFSGFDYGKAYTFQSRIIDKLNVVQSSEYTIRYLPIFDWGENDFNFNVPVNINADNVSMHDEIVLRYNKEAQNTVLSGGGGNIYLRPNGTESTSAETIFYGNGSIKFGGAVDLGEGFTIGGNQLADYIIETGEAAMGTNGTWYWAKWASGKSECWGCRNFGNMAVTTAWGNLYRSAILTQDLPDDVFKTTPDVININIVNSNYGGWICKHENLAPSAVTTGSFIFVRPASATVTPTYIGFHVIGLWK